jgi:hypothetical protein
MPAGYADADVPLWSSLTFLSLSLLPLPLVELF